MWLAASTHKGEDETVLKAHKQLGGLLIIVPRHTERASEIERLASSMGFVAKYALRRLTCKKKLKST